MPSNPSTALPAELQAHMEAIRDRARAEGLDYYDVVFEVVDFDTMNRLAAFGGFPVRYPHWRWGMEYESARKRDAYGLGRIYEMVINNDPCYAYLQESNAVIDQKLVMTHVFGHADFFKCNYWFSKTDRKMMDRMANHATRVRRHIEKTGQTTVEQFLDVCLSIEHLIDPHSPFVKRDDAPTRSRDDADPSPFVPDRFRARDYMDPYINPAGAIEAQRLEHERRRKEDHAKSPRKPTRDILLFLLNNAPLTPWQHDILSIVRDEAYYFAPQAMTKIMNEGWASYWHTKLMTERFAEPSEIIDYADKHAGVVFTPPGGFNPYKIGLELFRDIERRWNTGQHGPAWESLDTLGSRASWNDHSMHGRSRIFEVRRVYNDVAFIDEFFTEDFCDEHQLFRTRTDSATGQTRIASRDFKQIKSTLLQRLTNAGQPFIHVADANYLNRGELYLAHQWTGSEIDVQRALSALRNLRVLWGRPVHLQARVDDDMWLFSVASTDGSSPPKREKIKDGTPPPAHQIT